jgi:hypothetical protein
MTSKSIALLLSPFGLILIGATRLFIIADYNTTTAVTIASSGGYVSTLLGSVIPLLPVFMPYVALTLLLFRQFFLSIVAFVFAAFITPTPLTLPVALPIVKTEVRQIFSQSLGNALVPALILVLILVILVTYTNNLLEMLSAFVIVLAAFVLLFVAWNAHLTSPLSLSLAGNGEHRIIALWFENPLIAVLIAALPFIFVSIYNNSALVLASVMAIVATIVFIPYMYNIFPVPQHQNYYAQVIHELWLPSEVITLNSGYIYYGYVLSADTDWFTVLFLNSRTIVYLRTGEVARRAVCQAGRQDHPYPYPPLVRIFYTPPPRIPSCIPKVLSIRSDGESLNAISSAVYASPQQIISRTNIHLHHRLSAALRAYERRGDWNAPTPVGQYFYYYQPNAS